MAVDTNTKASISTRDQVGETTILPEKPTAKSGVAWAFKGFALRELERIEQSRSQNIKNHKPIKFADLKQFSDSFKLRTPVPTDIVPILTKDPLKQNEIQERALRNAEAVRVSDVHRNAAAKPNPQSKSPARSENDKVHPPDAQVEKVDPQKTRPYIKEVQPRVWVMPQQFDWTDTEMNKLILLKTIVSPKDFRRRIIDVRCRLSGYKREQDFD
jgi:hypothetical protein